MFSSEFKSSDKSTSESEQVECCSCCCSPCCKSLCNKTKKKKVNDKDKTCKSDCCQGKLKDFFKLGKKKQLHMIKELRYSAEILNQIVSSLNNQNYQITSTSSETIYNEEVINVSDDIKRDFTAIIKEGENTNEDSIIIWKSLNYKTIIRLYDIVPVHERFSIFILEKFNGTYHPMKNYIHSYEFCTDLNSVERMKKYIRQLLHALCYLHSKGYSLNYSIPDNMYIDTTTDTAKFLEFRHTAVANSLNGEEKNVIENLPYTPKGTYSSENWNKIELDLYALGCSIYELFVDVDWQLVTLDEPETLVSSLDKLNIHDLKEAFKNNLNEEKLNSFRYFIYRLIIRGNLFKSAKACLQSTFLKKVENEESEESEEENTVEE